MGPLVAHLPVVPVLDLGPVMEALIVFIVTLIAYWVGVAMGMWTQRNFDRIKGRR